MNFQASNSANLRLAVVIRGAVQGVGFRPFVYKLAADMKLNGWVSNSAAGVFIETEGRKEILDRFLLRLQSEIPPRAFIQSLEFSFLDPKGYNNFEIRESDASGEITSILMPDIATCPDCLREIFDASNRRYLYPFTNCTNCGPRFTIIEAMPYDRANTSMKIFAMCDECRHEYENPMDRRFHAQPNACPKCGPKIELYDNTGKKLVDEHKAMLKAVDMIKSGCIAAIKGIGGFHLVADAGNDESVARLRNRKHREEKPLALMFPSLKMIRRFCTVNNFEERLLTSPESPIVLIERISGTEEQNSQMKISPSVAPDNPYLGCMLPYSPLHHILMRELGIPVIATSGNLSDEPICTDENEAMRRLNQIADLFLVHNRPIVRHTDDSIVRVMMGRELVMRRARGYAPLPVTIDTEKNATMLAVGAHLKNTIALKSNSNIFISQHIGDLETKESFDAFHQVIADFQTLYKCKPENVVCDMHPDYLSSRFARNTKIPIVEIQHHYAHVVSCMAENRLEGNALGISWDGTGYGPDGTIWGGEFLLVKKDSFDRIATFRPFRLPGGEKAVKEPRRTALGILFEMYGNDLFHRSSLSVLEAFTSEELELLHQVLLKNVNSPITTSAGRIFDAVASMIGLYQKINYEGQAAMQLEFLTQGLTNGDCYPFKINDGKEYRIIDWQPIFEKIIDDMQNNIARPVISLKFHNTLAEIIVAIAKKCGEEHIVLSGGCFQNRYLTEHAVTRLKDENFKPYWHQRIPPNDGGIALGQIVAALRADRQNGS